MNTHPSGGIRLGGYDAQGVLAPVAEHPTNRRRRPVQGVSRHPVNGVLQNRRQQTAHDSHTNKKSDGRLLPVKHPIFPYTTRFIGGEP